MAASKKFVQKRNWDSLNSRSCRKSNDDLRYCCNKTAHIPPISFNQSFISSLIWDSLRSTPLFFAKKSFARAFRIADNSKNVLSGMFLEEYQSFRQLFADSYLLAPLVESELKNPQDSQAEIERLEKILELTKNKLRWFCYIDSVMAVKHETVHLL